MNMEEISSIEAEVSDEASALLDNFKVMQEAFEIYKNCCTAYQIIQQTYQREVKDTSKAKLAIDLMDKARFYCGELFERLKVMEKNYINMVRYSEMSNASIAIKQ